ncbi:MAG: hypothetical protein ACKPKO_00535, partial [Candidatus Fonsibacter sp.]
EEFAFLAETRLRSAESAFRMEAEQNEILAGMAKEVSSGSVARMMQMANTLQRERADKTNAELQANFVFSTAEQRVDALESFAERMKTESDENARLLSGSVNAVFSFEQDCESLRQTSASLNEDIISYQRAQCALQQTLQRTIWSVRS